MKRVRSAAGVVGSGLRCWTNAMPLDERKLRKTLWQFSLAVVAGEYERFCETSSESKDTRSAVEGYPFRLVPPPDDELDTLLYVYFEPSGWKPLEHGVVPKVYTAEEGWSGIEFRLTLWDAPDEVYRVRIDDVLA